MDAGPRPGQVEDHVELAATGARVVPGADAHQLPRAHRNHGRLVGRADPRDADTVQRISADAYIPAYMTVLGTIPKPATEDYSPRIERGEVWILEIEGEPLTLPTRGLTGQHVIASDG